MSEVLLLGLEAKDNATPTLEKFKKSINDVTKSFADVHKGADKFGSAMAGQMAKLPGISDSVGLLSKSLNLLKSPFVEIPVFAGLAATSLIAFANSNMKTVNELKRMSETTGISVNALAALKKVGAQTETSFETIVGAVTKLEKNLGESGKAFKKLKVEGHEPLEVLASLADRFKATNDPVERARLGFLAFGKSWKDMAPMLSEGGDAIRKAAEASTISESMVMRYDKMHRDQLAISGATGAWKSALGDLASGPLSLVTSMLAGMAKTSAEVAKNIRSATNKESDREYASNWLAGSDSAAQAKLKALIPEDLKRKSGLNFQANAKFSTADVRNQWALENFKKESIESQAAIINGYKNRGNIAGVLGDLTDETIAAMQANYDKLKKSQDKILGQGEGKKVPVYSDPFSAHEQNKSELLTSYDSMKESHPEFKTGIVEWKNSIKKYGLKATEDYYKDELKSIQAGEKLNNSTKLKMAKDAEKQEEAVLNAKLAYEEERLQLTLQQEKEMFAQFSSVSSQLLVGPLDEFVRHVGSHNMTVRGMFNDLWDGIETSFGNMLSKMLAELAAKSVLFGALNLLSSGGVGAATSALGGFSWFANGTNYAAGGRAIVAERESEVILPRGAQVIPMSKLGSPGGDTYNYNISTEGMTEKRLIRTLGTANRERARKRVY